MKRYAIEITGVNPIIMHADNVEWSSVVKAWQKDPKNKSMSVAGDDRSPAWTWIGYAYHDKEHLIIDTDNLMAMFRDAGKKMPATTGRGSLKAATQSAICVDGMGWQVFSSGKPIRWEPLAAMIHDTDFDAQVKAAAKQGVTLFVKRARVGSSKHVRVRPMIEDWSAAGTVMVSDDAITLDVLQSLMDVAGTMVGLCDWRPSSPASGRYGTFTAKVNPV